MSLPATMHCIEIREPGEPDVLVDAERPVPVPGDGQVLIQVAAAGVNRPDVIQRLGQYPPPDGASDLPGLEVSGTIVATGIDAGSWRPGDEVCALLGGGGYAEYAVADAGCCLAKPQAVSLENAAALPETVFTVWHNVFERGALKPKERLLVHGGSSGIGTTAIQMAKAHGAEVIITAGTEEKCAACRDLGADLAINYKSEDFVEIVRGLSPKGVDVILDMVGGDYIAGNLKCLRPDGRLVFIAFLQGAKTTVDFMPLMLKRLTVTGSTLRSRSLNDKAAIASAVGQTVWPWVEQGVLKPKIDRILPLSGAAEAHRIMESSSHIGKILLKPGLK
jgi:NADPH2:quinone reductase